MKLEFTNYHFDFKFLAITSRGKMLNRKGWFIKISDTLNNEGFGEISPISNLSQENIHEIPDILMQIKENINKIPLPRNQSEVYYCVEKLVEIDFSSVRFGLEMALMDLINGGKKQIFSNELSKINIPINGLIWMGDQNFIKKHMYQKLDEGFNCIKLKIGALDFDTELNILKQLRKISDEIVIKLDANGSFATNKVLMQLKSLEKFNIHSIEQPILPRQMEILEVVCKKSPIPIALDEELVGINTTMDRMELLREVKPHYLVLKPTLHGGFNSVEKWILLANKMNIKWWVTSYLETNIGLNAIAQFVSLYHNDEYQGLGTGALFHENILSPIHIDHGHLMYFGNVWGDMNNYFRN